MLRLILLVVSFVASVSVSAMTPEQVASRIDATLSELGRYKVHFTVSSGDDVFAGSLAVAGSDLCIETDAGKIFVQDGVKYDVDTTKREINIDTFDETLLPISTKKTFAEMVAQSESEAKQRNDGGYSLTLRDKGVGSSQKITMETDAKVTRVVSILISIDRMAPLKITLGQPIQIDDMPRFIPANYIGYETIDMR